MPALLALRFSIIWGLLIAIDSGKGDTGSIKSEVKPVPILRRALESAERDPDKDGVYLELAIAFAKAGAIETGLEVAGRCQNEQHRVAAIGSIAAVQAHAGDRAGAMKTAGMLPRAMHSSAILRIAIQESLKGDGDGAILTIYDEDRAGPELIQSLRMLAYAQETAEDFRGASRTYATIPKAVEQARGHRPLVLDLLKRGDVNGAFRAADEARQQLRDIAANGPAPRRYQRRLNPDSFHDGLLSRIAKEQMRAGDTAGSIATAERITLLYQKSLTIARLAQLKAASGDRATAKTLIARAFVLAAESGYKGDELTAIASAEAQAGEIDASRKTFLRAAETVGVVGNRVFVIDAQARSGDIEGALQSIESIPNEGVKDDSFHLVAKNAARAGQFVQAVAIAKKIRKAEILALALLDISESRAKAGDRLGAIEDIRRIESLSHNLSSDVIRSVNRVRASLGDIDGAMKWSTSGAIPETVRARALLGVAEGLLPDVKMLGFLPLENP